MGRKTKARAHNSDSPRDKREQDCRDQHQNRNLPPHQKCFCLGGRNWSLDYSVLGLLEVVYEARDHFLGIKAEVCRIAAKERQEVKLIGDGVVFVALDHSHIVGGNVGLVRDLFSRKTALLASLGYELAERLINFETGKLRRRVAWTIANCG